MRAHLPSGRGWSGVQRGRLQPRTEWLRGRIRFAQRITAGRLDPVLRYDELRRAVETGYQHKSYAYRGQRLEEFDRFLRRMRAGDLVLTTMQGGVYLGEVTGRLDFAESERGLSNLRRDVRWHNPDRSDRRQPAACPCPALLQSQAYIVDLTEAYEQSTALIPPEVSAPTADHRHRRKRTRVQRRSPPSSPTTLYGPG